MARPFPTTYGDVASPLFAAGPGSARPLTNSFNADDEKLFASIENGGDIEVFKEVSGNDVLAKFSILVGHWSGRGQHVEFGRKDEIPLKAGAWLGRGASADVDQVTCRGVTIARKQIYCSRRIKIEDVKRELDILKRLNHKHIVTLIGSYTQKNILGLMLFPAAVCDLGIFLDELDEHQKSGNGEIGENLAQLLECLRIYPRLGWALDRLRRIYGCLAKAVEYLHENGIRHKDIKPSNVLLNPTSSLFLTDFGISTDFTDASTSVTDGIARGTYKYCAPEVARWEPRGRAADVYSLGCVFLQIETVNRGLSLLDLDKFRSSGDDQSFQKSPDRVRLWIHKLHAAACLPPSEISTGIQLLDLIQAMLEEHPVERRTIQEVTRDLADINSKAFPERYFGRCCMGVLNLSLNTDTRCKKYRSAHRDIY
jgi:serine/threonine protein kinase